MPDNAYNVELHSLSPSAVIELFKLEIPGESPLLFHKGTNGLNRSIVWGGDGDPNPDAPGNIAATYVFFPIDIQGMEVSGQGLLPTPTLRVANATGVISALLLFYDDLVGAKLTRIRTFHRFLDAVNFPNAHNPSANPNLVFPLEVFFIEQKSAETPEIVEFKLASSLDVEGVLLPSRRIIADLCSWEYRGPECTFSQGLPWSAGRVYIPPEHHNFIPHEHTQEDFIVSFGGVFYRAITQNIDRPPSDHPEDWARDYCKKTVFECKTRFTTARTPTAGVSTVEILINNETGTGPTFDPPNIRTIPYNVADAITSDLYQVIVTDEFPVGLTTGFSHRVVLHFEGSLQFFAGLANHKGFKLLMRRIDQNATRTVIASVEFEKLDQTITVPGMGGNLINQIPESLVLNAEDNPAAGEFSYEVVLKILTAHPGTQYVGRWGRRMITANYTAPPNVLPLPFGGFPGVSRIPNV